MGNCEKLSIIMITFAGGKLTNYKYEKTIINLPNGSRCYGGAGERCGVGAAHH